MAQTLVKVAEKGQLIPGQMIRIMAGDRAVLLANVDGALYAIDDQCSHEDASLYKGALKGDCVECPLHGSRFNLKTGQPREEPATQPVRTYQTCEREDGIYIKIQGTL